MRPLVLAVLILLALGCDATQVVDLRVPFCPRSDSAWARADSVPLGCPPVQP